MKQQDILKTRPNFSSIPSNNAKQNPGQKRFFYIIIGIPLSLLCIYIYHRFLIWYGSKLSNITGNIDIDNIGIIGDSLGALCFFALIFYLYLIIQTLQRQSQELMFSRKELELNREEMKLQREEVKTANKQRAESEVLENIRMLAGNIKAMGEDKQKWDSDPTRLVISFNLSQLIKHSLEVLVKITREEYEDNPLLARFAQEVIEKNKNNLGKLNLSGKDLQKANLEKANLHASLLHETILIEANLMESNLKKADLPGADLQRANLKKANLEEANFHGANLREAKLQEAKVHRATLQGADLWGADLKGTDLSGAYLWKTNLRETDLRETNLRDADLREADLSGANLTGADLSRSNISGANLSGTILSEATLQGANLKGTHFWGAHFWQTDLSEANLQKGKGITINQLRDTKSLHKTVLDPDLRQEIKAGHNHLFQQAVEN